jgi:hypothetical protein
MTRKFQFSDLDICPDAVAVPETTSLFPVRVGIAALKFGADCAAVAGRYSSVMIPVPVFVNVLLKVRLLVALLVAALVMVKLVPLTMDVIAVFAGIPVPATDMPTTKVAVLAVVMVVVAFVVHDNENETPGGAATLKTVRNPSLKRVVVVCPKVVRFAHTNSSGSINLMACKR